MCKEKFVFLYRWADFAASLTKEVLIYVALCSVLSLLSIYKEEVFLTSALVVGRAAWCEVWWR